MNILITAGPTIEPIDPVRFISNRSTGVMGFAIAEAAGKRGHKVILISGPTRLAPPRGVKFFPVETARQMQEQVLKNFPKAGVVIMAAAVSDYRPAVVAAQKIKKGPPAINLKLVKNPDILEALARQKKDKIVVGFSLETENLYKGTLAKLKKKNLDLIVANQLTKRQDIFGNKKMNVLILDKKGNKKQLWNVEKTKVAKEIILRVENY